MKKINLDQNFKISHFKNDWATIFRNQNTLEKNFQNIYDATNSFFSNIYKRIHWYRDAGVKNTSLDLEMLALGMVGDLYDRRRNYKSNDENLSPSLKKLDDASKKIVLKAIEFDVKNVEDVINFPHLEELLDAFMKADQELAESLVGIEMGEL